MDSNDLYPSETLEQVIVRKVAFLGRSSIPGDPYYEERKRLLFEKIILEVRAQYKNAQKKAMAIYNLMHPINDALRYFCKLPSPDQILPVNDMTSFDRAQGIRGLRRGVHKHLNDSALFF